MQRLLEVRFGFRGIRMALVDYGVSLTGYFMYFD